jgi:hypothetical protein
MKARRRPLSRPLTTAVETVEDVEGSTGWRRAFVRRAAAVDEGRIEARLVRKPYQFRILRGLANGALSTVNLTADQCPERASVVASSWPSRTFDEFFIVNPL